jgi:hypothetical protein
VVEAAAEYLIASGQEDAVGELPVADVRSMVELAQQIAADPNAVLPSHVAELARERETVRRSRTIRLNVDLAEQLTDEVEKVARQPVLDEVPGSAVPARSGELN